MSALRRGAALSLSLLMVGVLAACEPAPTDPGAVVTCAPDATTTTTPPAGVAYTIHTEYQPEGGAAVVRDTTSTTGQTTDVDGDATAGADLCVTVNVDTATHVPTIEVHPLSTAPAVYPILVQAEITSGGIVYKVGYDARTSTVPALFSATTNGLATDFKTLNPGASLKVIGAADQNEASGSYSPVPATGHLAFGLGADGISISQIASAPIDTFHGSFSVGGVFLVDMPATSMPASSVVHIGLDPVDVKIQSSGTIGHVELGLKIPEGLIGRATQGTISLDDVPADVQVTIAPDMSGVTFDAHGGTVGAIEAQFSDGSTDALPAGVDGVLFEDLADRYVIFGRITGLRRIGVGLEGTKISANIDITGNQVFKAVIKTQATAADPVGTTTAVFDHLVPDMNLLVDTADGQVQAQYSASSATNSLTVDSNAMGADPIHLSLAPVPQNLSLCFASTNACLPQLNPGVTSVSLRASEQTTLNASVGAVKAENVKVTWLDAGFLIDPAPAGWAYFDTDGMPLEGHITDGASVDILAPPGFSSRQRSIHFWLTYFLFIPIVHMERSGTVTCPAGTSVSIQALGSMMDVTYGIYFGPFRLADGICDGSSGVDPTQFKQIHNTALDRCVDIDRGNTANGVWALSYPCTSNPNQGFMQRADGSLAVLTNYAKCLDGSAGAVGDHVLIWDCKGGDNQAWTIDGTQIINRVNNLCLTVNGDNAMPGTPMVLQPCDGSTGQQFNVETQAANSYQQLYNPAMAQCAALSGGTTGSGTWVVSWGCDGSPSQGWNLDPSGNVTSKSAPGACLDAEAGTVGSHAVLWPCKDSANQKWTLNGTQLINSVNGLCLAIDGGQTTPGTAFKVADCDGSPSQQFVFNTLQAQAFGQLINPGLNECVSTKNGSMGNGTHTVAYPCDGTPSQGWTGTLAGTINNSANQGKCLDADTGSVGDNVILWDCHGTANQQWTVENGQITNDINNLCLAVPGNSAVPDTALVLQACNGSPEQQFSVDTQQAAASQQIYSGALDRCIDIADSSTGNGTWAELYPCTANANQQFQTGPAGQILSSMNLAKCLDNTSDTVGAHVVLFDCKGSTNQKWTEDGTSLVTNNGLCLDVATPASRPGVALALAGCDNSPNQQWVQQSPRPAVNQVIRNSAEHTCVGLQSGSLGDGTAAVSWACLGQADAMWHLDPNGQLLNTAALSKCLDVSSQGVAGAVVQLYPCNGDVYQKWTLDNGQLINAKNNLCLTSKNGSMMMGSPYTVETCDGSAAQSFELDTSSTQAPYKVRNAALERCIQPVGDTAADGTSVVSRPCAPGAGQQFDVTADGHLVSGLAGNKCVDGSQSFPAGLAVLYRCKAVAWQQWDFIDGQAVNRYDGKCLTIREGSLISGVSISTETCNGSDSQKFSPEA